MAGAWGRGTLNLSEWSPQGTTLRGGLQHKGGHHVHNNGILGIPVNCGWRCSDGLGLVPLPGLSVPQKKT